MKIKEVEKSADRLIEIGREIETRKERIQTAIGQAQRRMAEAQLELARASETDEDGEPMGDVSYARAEVAAARMDMEMYMGELREAEMELETVRREKMDTVYTLDAYYESESQNLAKLRTLEGNVFGGNVNGFVAAIVGRMGVAESTKAALYQSMGMSYSERIPGTSGGAVTGRKALMYQNFASSSVQGWTSRLNELSSRLQRYYSLAYGQYISSERLSEHLSQTIRYEIGDVFRANGKPDGVLGYYNGVIAHVAVGTQHETQTTVHENLHRLSHNGSAHGIVVRENGIRKNVGINEGITELLTRRTMGDTYGKEYSLYQGNRDAVEMLERSMGEDIVAEAYFQNKPHLLQERYERVLGAGSWDELSKAFDDSISRDRKTREEGARKRDSSIMRYLIASRAAGGNKCINQILV